jgi:hypothetical protein
LIRLNEEIAQNMCEAFDHLAPETILKAIPTLSENAKNYLLDKPFYKEGKEDKFVLDTANQEKARLELKEYLKAANYSDEEIAISLRLARKQILTSPYSEKQRFKTINPALMVSLLSTCLVKKEPPPIFAHFFAM